MIATYNYLYPHFAAQVNEYFLQGLKTMKSTLTSKELETRLKKASKPIVVEKSGELTI